MSRGRLFMILRQMAGKSESVFGVECERLLTVDSHWGLLTVDRQLKQGVKIPDCGGKTMS